MSRKGGDEFMIELFLSSDGKHTVHASADTPEQLNGLLPAAKTLYYAIVQEFGTKAQQRQETVYTNGQAPVGKRADTVEQAREVVAPLCPTHKRPMRYREGRLGPFWSCPTRKPDGRWCQV